MLLAHMQGQHLTWSLSRTHRELPWGLARKPTCVVRATEAAYALLLQVAEDAAGRLASVGWHLTLCRPTVLHAAGKVILMYTTATWHSTEVNPQTPNYRASACSIAMLPKNPLQQAHSSCNAACGLNQ